MRVLFTDPLSFTDAFAEAFERLSPSAQSFRWPSLPADGAYDLLVTWKLPDEVATLPGSLQAVFCFGSGTDHVLRDPRIPHHLPIVRLQDSGQAAQILDYAAHATFAHLQHDTARLLDQQAGIWRLAAGAGSGRRDLRVTVLGLGPIGQTVASGLAAMGFAVSAWSRTPRILSNVTTHSGVNGLSAAVEKADVLVNLLPLQPETENILSAALFQRMAAGATLVNLGRGGHLHEDDLRSALDSSQLGCAWLDVYRQEPLPQSHWFWSHDRVRMTPHLAGLPTAEGAAASVAAVVAALGSGAPLPGLVRAGTTPTAKC